MIQNGYAKGETLAMKNTGTYFTNHKDKMTWDDRLKLYYLSIPTSSGSDRIWFEDNTSLGLKLDLVKELKTRWFLLHGVKVLKMNLLSL